jgi:hypothetical protein
MRSSVASLCQEGGGRGGGRGREVGSKARRKLAVEASHEIRPANAQPALAASLDMSDALHIVDG